MLVRTNHFVSEAGRDGCLASSISVSTELRRATWSRRSRRPSRRPPRTSSTAMTHHLADGGVCRHPITSTDPVLWHRTLATVAIDVAGRSLDVHENGPCGHRMLPVEQPA